jgi:hypothetical protein
VNEESLAHCGLLHQIKKKMGAADSHETVVSAPVIRVRSAIKQKREIGNLSQLFRNSGYLKNNLHSAVLSICVSNKFYIQQQL